jgi:hypothetical protein
MTESLDAPGGVGRSLNCRSDGSLGDRTRVLARPPRSPCLASEGLGSAPMS